MALDKLQVDPNCNETVPTVKEIGNKSKRTTSAVSLSRMSSKNLEYLRLKLMRDAQFVKLTNASERLLDIKILGAADLMQELKAERTLLENLKKKLIESKIMALKNEKDESKTASDKKMSTVKISEINFTIEPDSSFFRDYWMIAVTHNDDLYMSEPMMPDKDGKLSFKDEFTVFDFEDSLDVQVEVFSIRLHGGRADDDSANCSEDWCNLSFYDDFKINGSRIVKSSFQSCGKFTLTAKSTKSSFNKLTSRMLSDLSAPLMLNKLSPTKLKENIGRCLSVDMLCTM
ncbi:unnamed protein product [Acanthoscelides obtectus]|uniref:Uncharacterized protein n=1 Tax=Acanthoscelides obtectus TaxID=200917 RepID=A0A9P0LGS3_ACAOB|nr:unnamed protein product [Acanthoscelides obtectus]CAK1626983.1 hypothetical protein AOBTE_LOCUS4191 [Acanthoscelides obtectus]